MVIERPHMAHPYQRGGYVEQDTAAHVQSREFAVASCRVGFRDEAPEFGWPIPVGRPMPADFGDLRDALARTVPSGTQITLQQAEDVYGESVDAFTQVISDGGDDS